MGCDGTGFASIAETTSFLHHFNGLPDHRQAGEVDYPLPEVVSVQPLDALHHKPKPTTKR